MRVTELIINNIGMISEEEIKLDKPLILFYGEIRQGKTTILNAVRWVCGGSFPTDIIRHGQKYAHIELRFPGGSIRREFYIAKDGSTKARDIQFVKDGRIQDNPVARIKSFLNPFLLDQDHLRNMSETERKRFFVETFAVDTSDLDKEAVKADREASDLRFKIKGYGDIDLTEVKQIDTGPLREQLRQVKADHAIKVGQIDLANADIRSINAKIDTAIARKRDLDANIANIEKQLADLKKTRAGAEAWIEQNRKQPEQERPQAPDTSAIESEIEAASANQVRFEQYQANIRRYKERKADSDKLVVIEKRQREIKSERFSRLKEISKTCGVPDLEFDDGGNPVYQGTQMSMLSTSQVMALSSALSALYPEGFGLDLIDRAESLGKSIFGFIQRAKDEKKTILATIVGEKPTKVPDEVGVFVVEGGKIKTEYSQ